MTKIDIIKKLKTIHYQTENMSNMKTEECFYFITEEMKKNLEEIDFGYISFISQEAQEIQEVEQVIKEIINSEEK